MASTESDTAVVSCPGCGARFAISLSMVGRHARCAACDAAFIVPTPADGQGAAAEPTPNQPETPGEVPQYIGFECRVCGTRMYDRPDQVGKKAKCPDCGALSVIPPPPKPKPKNLPAALEGKQYELWDTEDQPLPSQIIAAQPKYIAVTCRRCDTVMYPTEKQIGGQIRCPDCGTMNVVPPPPKRVTRPSVIAPDALTPALDPAAHPGERPAVTTSKARMLHEQEHEAEYRRAVEKSRRTGKPMEIDIHGRPIMPRWPLLSGILPFVFSSGVPIAWLTISLSYIATGLIFLKGLELAMMGDMAAIAGMCFFAIACVMAMLCSAGTSSVMLQIIMESSEGNRTIHHWQTFVDWFGTLLYTGTACMMSAVPGWAIGRIPPLNSDPSISALLSAVSVFVFLPIAILSQLDTNSPWGVVSARILASLLRCPFSWTLFYLECAALAAICSAVTYFWAGPNTYTVLWWTPLYVAALILCSRLLGRLAWRLAEAMPIEAA